MMSGAADLRSSAQRFVDIDTGQPRALALCWKLRLKIAVSLMALLGPAVPSLGQTWTGTASNDWTNAANWTGGVPANGAVTIRTTTPNPTLLGTTGPDVATSGSLTLGTTGGTGNLTIQNGSTLASQNLVSFGATAGSTGVATVTGAGSTWTMNVPVVGNSFRLGSFGAGTLNVRDGGAVAVTGGMSLGFSSGGSGILNIESGGTLTTSNFVHIGGSVGGTTGVVTVTGANSLLDVGTDLVLGLSGNGTLNIQNGATAVAGVTTVSVAAASTGALNISGNGTLETSRLVAGAGAAQVNFDAARLRATADEANFVTGFSGTELNIQAGGLTVDSAGFNVAAVSPFSGVGAFTKIGAGTLTLTGANTFSGHTWIQAGTLALSGSGSIANSSGVVADGTFDISAVTPISVSVQRLAGAGTVALGAKNLTIANANDTFAGSITGTGSLTVSAGTQTLTGTSNYTGPTVVNGTGTLQLLNGGQIIGTSGTTLNGPSPTATVSGTGSLLQTGTLALGGSAGSNATLNILNGGVVRTTNVNVASGNLAQTAAINVDGAGSLLDLAGSLNVGTSGSASNAFLNITNGGAVESTSGIVGSFPAATGTKSVVIAGSGSSWTMSANLNISSGGSVAVLNGGAVTAATSNIGATPGSGRLLIWGPGSEYSIAGNVLIGGGSGTGVVTLADAGLMRVGGALTLGNAAVSTSILNIGGAEGQAATDAGILNAATLAFGPGVGRLNFNHTNAHYSFATALSGAGTVNHTGPGLTEVTGHSAAFAGTTNVAAGTLAVNGTLCGDMNVQAGGRLQGIGTVCDTTNAGIIAPGNSIGTLTVDGDYVGTGGLLEIETELGGDSSPTDLLRVTGNTSGNTNVRVTNVGGTGGVTTEGIRIVQVDGSSDGDFALLGDYVFEGEQAVVGGAYAYRLYQNGVSTPSDGDWYLRSTLANPVTPPSAPIPPGTPLYQPGVPLYESYANVLQSFNALGTLRQRLGGRSWTGAGVIDTDVPTDILDQLGAWGRIEASHVRFDPETSTSGASYDVDLWKLQAGTDGILHNGDAGSLIGGFSLEYGTLSADIASPHGDGSINSTGFGVGSALTWYGSTGFYLDGQARVTWYDSDLSSSTAGLNLATDNGGFGYAVSIEGGQQIALGPNWSITPQAQLAYSDVDFDSFTDAFGAAVSSDNGQSLKARLGISVDYRNEWTGEAGQAASANLYGIANLYYDMLDGSRTDVAGVKFTSENDPLWGGVGIGASYNWGDGKYALHGEASLNTSLRNFGDSYAAKGTVGLSVKF